MPSGRRATHESRGVGRCRSELGGVPDRTLMSSTLRMCVTAGGSRCFFFVNCRRGAHSLAMIHVRARPARVGVATGGVDAHVRDVDVINVYGSLPGSSRPSEDGQHSGRTAMWPLQSAASRVLLPSSLTAVTVCTSPDEPASVSGSLTATGTSCVPVGRSTIVAGRTSNGGATSGTSTAVWPVSGDQVPHDKSVDGVNVTNARGAIPGRFRGASEEEDMAACSTPAGSGADRR